MILASAANAGTSVAATHADQMPPSVEVQPGGDPPVKRIDPEGLRQFGMKLEFLFRQYVSDRRMSELRWLRNERQYLGIYDPEIEKEFSANRPQAYPRIARVKCTQVQARLMSLMFPGNEKNWEIKASPTYEFTTDEIKVAIAAQQKLDEADPQQMDLDYGMTALQNYSDGAD